MLICWTTLATAADPAPTAAPVADADQAPSKSAPQTTPIPASRQADNIVVITIKGPIDKWTSYSVRRRLELAEKEGADAVVFDLNTPGGEIGAVLEITNAIKGSSIPNTVAWVNKMAYSGGAIIALACREIVVNDPSTMGDAAPIAVSPVSGLMNLNETERAKMLAPLLAELVDSARRSGYDELLVQAFVMTGVELWMVENIETGQRLFVDEKEYSLLFDNDPPRSRVDLSAADIPPAPTNPSQPGASTTSFRLASPPLTDTLEGDVADMLQFKGAPSRRPTISGTDRGKYKLIGYATNGGLLTLKTSDLHRYGFSKRVVHNDEQLKQFFGARSMERYKASWSEHMARFLSSLPVKGFLVVIFLLALFMEMAAPGLGLAGGVALFCLAALVAPQFLVGAAAWWGLASVGGGLLLIAIELFVIPGFGVPGVLGVVFMMLGLLGIMVGPGGFSGPGASDNVVYGAATLLLAIFTAGVGMYFLAKNYQSIPLFNKLILTGNVGDEEPHVTMLSSMGDPDPTKVKIGKVGVVTTPLRPAGTAEIDDRLVDVVSDYGFVETGKRVRVTEVGRFRIVVAPIDDEPKESA